MQRRILFGLLLILLMVSFSSAQSFVDPFRVQQESYIDGGLGITWIDGQPHTTFTLTPEFSLGGFIGIGLQLQLLYDNNNNFKIRNDEYEDGAGILRVIRYIRFGQKYGDYYFRIGALDRTTLGNGFLMWNYNNESNYDKRKIGTALNLDFGKFGFESMWSSIGTSSLRGGNFYLRPFRFLDHGLPLIDRLRVYFTLISDNNVATGDSLKDERTLSAYGIGADLQWLDLSIVRSSIYADHGKINDFGSGQAYGINWIFPEFVGIFQLAAKFEKRFNNDEFIPQIYGPLYELHRKAGIPVETGNNGPQVGVSIFDMLGSATSTEGYFGELSGHIINRVLLTGNFQKLNGVENSGVLHLEASAPRLVPKFELRGYYDKTGIETFEDARTLDNRSLATAEVSYRLNRFMLLTMLYRWYWVEKPVDSGNFEPIERVEPRISFRYRF